MLRFFSLWRYPVGGRLCAGAVGVGSAGYVVRFVCFLPRCHPFSIGASIELNQTTSGAFYRNLLRNGIGNHAGSGTLLATLRALFCAGVRDGKVQQPESTFCSLSQEDTWQLSQLRFERIGTNELSNPNQFDIRRAVSSLVGVQPQCAVQPDHQGIFFDTWTVLCNFVSQFNDALADVGNNSVRHSSIITHFLEAPATNQAAFLESLRTEQPQGGVSQWA